VESHKSVQVESDEMLGERVELKKEVNKVEPLVAFYLIWMFERTPQRLSCWGLAVG
jgi:hypothetical protein